MELKKQLENALKEAMKSADEPRKRTIRLIMASIKNLEIDKGSSLDDAGILNVIQKEIKIRKEAIEGAEQAHREDLKVETQKEVMILETFLPTQLGDDELRAMIKNSILEVQATSINETGKVMKALMPKVQGRATGDRISQLVREILQE
ncbi:MAG: GatB/YqeY domain-containing protein [Bellilinea sp.]|jgi:uncharacterized protein YqeY